MKIEDKINSLKDAVSKFDTQSFSGFFAYFIKHRPDYSLPIEINKFESKLKDFLYLISLNAFSESTGNEEFTLNPELLGVFADDLNEIKKFENIDFQSKSTLDSVIHKMAMQTHFDNGVLSYFEQDLEKLKRTFLPFEKQILEDFGFDIHFIVGICQEIEFISLIRQTHLTSFMNSEDFNGFKSRVENLNMSFSKSFELMEQETQDKFLSFCAMPYASLLFTEEDLSNRFANEQVKTFLSILSIEPIGDKSTRYYSAESPFETKPILKLPNGSYLNIYGKQIPLAIFNTLYKSLSENKKSHDKLRRHREKDLEKKVTELFRDFFPDQNTLYFSNYFVEKNFEQDLLIIHGDTAVIIETKATKLREPFRDESKAIEKLRSDFNNSIQFGYEQCCRVEKLLNQHSDLEIKNSKLKAIQVLETKEICRIFSIIVTRERYGNLQTDLSLMLEKNDAHNYPWSVYIDDLEVFLLSLKRRQKRHVQGLLDYLELRMKLHGRIYAVDELDICASFLQNSKMFRLQANNEKVFMNFSPHQQNYFDKLYWKGQLKFTEKPLPEEYYKYGIPL